MKQLLLRTTLLTVAGAVLFTASARAYSPGDFVIGFHQTGTNTSIAGSFTLANFTTQQTFDLGTVGSTFSTTFGSGWATDSTVLWGVVGNSNDGQGNPVGPDYVSRPEIVGGNESASASLASTLIQNFANKVFQAGSQLSSGTAISGSSLVTEDRTALPNAWQNFLTGGTNDAGHAQGNVDWGFYSGTSATQANLGLGITGRTVDIYQLTGTPSAGTDLGDFSLAFNAGTGDLTVTFTPDSFEAIPEPSTCALVSFGAFGAITFMSIRRRRRSVTA